MKSAIEAIDILLTPAPVTWVRDGSRAVAGLTIMVSGGVIDAICRLQQIPPAGHLHDVTLCLGGSLISRAMTTNRHMAALLYFSGCSTLEVLQHFQLYKGTFDPIDFAAYGFGTAVGYTINRKLDREHQSL